MVGVILKETLLFLLLTLSPLPLASAQDTYYVRPTASEATPPCEDCLTLSEYAREASTYFNSDNLTLVFLPGEHSLDTTIVFELLESVLLVGNTDSLPSITSKIVCSRQLAALSFINVSKVEIKALAFAYCGNGSIESPDVIVDLNHMHMLLEQPDVRIPAVSALFIPIFHFTSCSMEHCFLPLLLNKSRVYFQYNTFQYNMGHFGGAVAAYDSTLVFLGRNIFQYNNAVVGGGVFAKGTCLAFSGFTAFIGNVAQFGGGGVSAIESSMSNNESLQRKLLQHYDSNVYRYVGNTAALGGGLLLVNSAMKLGGGTLEFTANSAEGGGIYSKFSTVMLEGNALFKDNSAGNNDTYGSESGGAVFVSFSMWTTTAVTFTGNTAVDTGGAVYTESSLMNFRGIAWNIPEEPDIPLFETCAYTCLMYNSAGIYGGGGLFVWNSNIEFDGNTLLWRNSAGVLGGGGIATGSYSKLHFKCNTTFLQNSAIQGGGLLAFSHSIAIIFEGHTRFIGNSAAHDGGGIAMNINDNSAHHGGGLSAQLIIISGETTFVGNHGSISGGGLYLVNSFLYVTGNGTFINNTATYFGGAGHCKDNCSLILEGEYTLIGNEATFGGAISVNKDQATVSGKNCLVQNRADYGGAIFAKESKSIELVGKNSFLGNTARSIGYGGYGGGIHAVKTKIIISGVLNVTNNSAWYGGGLSIIDYDSDHFIFVSHHTNILFFSNFAQNHGGAVLIEDAPSDYCANIATNCDYCASDFNVVVNARSCFFKFLDINVNTDSLIHLRNEILQYYMQTCSNSITFEDNLAKQGGDAIYGGALHVCRVPIPQLCSEEEYLNNIVSGLEAVAALMNMTMEQMTASPHGIASDPFKVCICDNLKPECSRRAVTQDVYPGETVMVWFPESSMHRSSNQRKYGWTNSRAHSLST